MPFILGKTLIFSFFLQRHKNSFPFFPNLLSLASTLNINLIFTGIDSHVLAQRESGLSWN